MRQMESQVEALKTTVAEREGLTNLVLNSRSWRYTRPLRFLKSVVRGRGLFGEPED
jgi:hypothetical protein